MLFKVLSGCTYALSGRLVWVGSLFPRVSLRSALGYGRCANALSGRLEDGLKAQFFHSPGQCSGSVSIFVFISPRKGKSMGSIGADIFCLMIVTYRIVLFKVLSGCTYALSGRLVWVGSLFPRVSLRYTLGYGCCALALSGRFPFLVSRFGVIVDHL